MGFDCQGRQYIFFSATEFRPDLEAPGVLASDSLSLVILPEYDVQVPTSMQSQICPPFQRCAFTAS